MAAISHGAFAEAQRADLASELERARRDHGMAVELRRAEEDRARLPPGAAPALDRRGCPRDRSASDARRARFGWAIHREHHDDDGEPSTPVETDLGDGRLAEVAQAAVPSCPPPGESPDGDGYSPWLFAEPDPDDRRGE